MFEKKIETPRLFHEKASWQMKSTIGQESVKSRQEIRQPPDGSWDLVFMELLVVMMLVVVAVVRIRMMIIMMVVEMVLAMMMVRMVLVD